MVLGMMFSLLPVFSCSSSLTGWSLDAQVTLAGLTFQPVLEVKNNHSYFHIWVNGFELFAVLLWCFISSCGAFLSQCLSIRMSSWLTFYLKILFCYKASISSERTLKWMCYRSKFIHSFLMINRMNFYIELINEILYWFN